MRAFLSIASVGVLLSTRTALAEEPVLSALKFLYENAKTNVIASAEKGEAALYAYKPAEETRTFAQQLTHIADANYLFCSASLGRPNPHHGAGPGRQGELEKTKTGKTEIVEAVRASFALCDEAFDQATDASLSAMIDFATGRGASKVPRASVLALALYHSGQHYGSLATYFRLNGLVPPSTERDLEQRDTNGYK